MGGKSPIMTASEEARSILERTQPRSTPQIIFRFTEKPTVDMLYGNRFMVSSREGDLFEEEHGVFANDTRHLSLYKAEINGMEPTVLTSSNTTHYSAGFYLTNPKLPPTPATVQIGTSKNSGTNEIPRESLAIHRMRFMGHDVREEYFITNVCGNKLSFILSFKVDADFADIFEVKEKVFAEKPDMLQRKIREAVEEEKEQESKLGPTTGSFAENSNSSNQARKKNNVISKNFLQDENAFDFVYENQATRFKGRTLVWFSKRGRVEQENTIDGKSTILFDLSLEPKETYHLTIVIVILSAQEKKRRRYTDQYFETKEERVARALEAWDLRVPRFDSNWDELKHSYYQSFVDIASLRMTDPSGRHAWELPAAGCPWFMTLFGRDTLITSYQSMILGPGFAKGAIEALSEYQAAEVNPQKDAEPGKIIHELRFGEYASVSNRFPYYGTVDATPLFLILISEIYRWTLDVRFVNKMRPNIMSALSWIDSYGDVDRDSFVEYRRRSGGGLENQCWKDSWNSIQFSNGELAEAPIATCEVQGYVYDAKMRASEIAGEVWKDSSLSKKLKDEALELKKLFNERFWMEDRGYYALALDKEKKQVDALTSNNGQLLWSGIVDQRKRADLIAEKIVDPNLLFSGYGVRTLSKQDRGYSPIGYHNGCVWAHDNSLIAEGLARYGKAKEANVVIDAMLSTGPHFGYTMPETFAGFPRLETGFPVRYPTSSSPQAWAAGASFLFLKTILGLNPFKAEKCLKAVPILRERETSFDLEGIEALGKKFVIRLRDGAKPDVYEQGSSSKKK